MLPIAVNRGGSKMKWLNKKLCCFVMLMFIAALPFNNITFAASEPTMQVSISQNGSQAVYAPDGTVVIFGQVTNVDGYTIAEGTMVRLTITDKKDQVIMASDVYTNAFGYYRTITTLPSDIANGTYKINALTSGSNVATSTIKVDSSQVNGVGFEGYYPNLTQSIPASTRVIQLAFSSNVNYFYNKDYPDQVIGVNEANIDSIRLYKSGSNTPLPVEIELISSPAEDESGFTYYTADDQTMHKDGERKRIINIIPKRALSADSSYDIEIDGTITANNGSYLGSTQIITFNTEPRKNSDVISSDGAFSEDGIRASDIGTVTVAGKVTTVVIDDRKAMEELGNTSHNTLSINMSDIQDSNGSLVKLPAKVISGANEQDKPIVFKYADRMLYIPPGALPEGKSLSISMSPVQEEVLSGTHSELKPLTGYNISISDENGNSEQIGKAITFIAKIPDGVGNPELLTLQYVNTETGEWEYMGGRIVDGLFTAGLPHFSEYVIAESTKTFGDIVSHWAKDDIEVMTARQIIYGIDDNTFAPQNNITRAEFTALLSRVLKLPDVEEDNAFKDITGSEWFANDVKKAAKAGIINGFNGSFRPSDRITRQEMAVMINSAYSYAGGKTDTLKELTFTDKTGISSWANDAVKSVYSLGIINGRTDGSFGAKDNATRAEGTVMLKNLMDKLGL